MQPQTLGPEPRKPPVTPSWVIDLESFRRWAYSGEYPETGWVSYLAGQIWSDPGPEELFSHNQVRGEFLRGLYRVVNDQDDGGWFFSGHPLWTNRTADLATEPDGLFASWKTLRHGRLAAVPDPRGGPSSSELTGSPDMVLEIVSDASEQRDCGVFPRLFWLADVPEFWLVDARGDTPQFSILSRTAVGYVALSRPDEWQFSAILEHEFRLLRSADQLGHPQYTLERRSLSPRAKRTTP